MLSHVRVIFLIFREEKVIPFFKKLGPLYTVLTRNYVTLNEMGHLD